VCLLLENDSHSPKPGRLKLQLPGSLDAFGQHQQGDHNASMIRRCRWSPKPRDFVILVVRPQEFLPKISCISYYYPFTAVLQNHRCPSSFWARLSICKMISLPSILLLASSLCCATAQTAAASTTFAAEGTSTASSSSSSGTGTPKVHRVNIGAGGFMYDPNVTIADVGDIVTFVFYPTNHSVIRGEYTGSEVCGSGGCNPCESWIRTNKVIHI